MDTTIMRDSKVGDAWIAEMCRLNPVMRLTDPKTNQPIPGFTRLCPTRLSFTDAVFEPKPKFKADPNSKLGFGVTFLFPPYADFTLLWEDYCRVAQSDFPNETWNDYTKAFGQLNPLFGNGKEAIIKECGAKQQLGGYTPDLKYMQCGSNFAPSVVDIRGNPITDKTKVYPGVWAIGVVNVYASGKGTPNRGPRFGLQTLMIVGDDTKLGGGGIDARTAYVGVNVTPPQAAPAAAFGVPQQPQAPAGIGAYYPPQPAAPGAPPAVDPYAQFG